MVLRSANGDILVDPDEGRREVGAEKILLRKMKITATETKPLLGTEASEHSELQELHENKTEIRPLYDGNYKQIVETESYPAAATEEIITNVGETVTKVGKSDNKSFTVGDKENAFENFGVLSENKNNTDQNIRSNEERKKPETKQSEITVLPKTKNKDISKIPNKKQNTQEDNKIKTEQKKFSPGKTVLNTSNKNHKTLKDDKIATEQIKPAPKKLIPHQFLRKHLTNLPIKTQKSQRQKIL